MNSMSDDIQKFLNSIFTLAPDEVKLYQEAFIHSSNNSSSNNQRLAFLGDSVLRLIIREHFYRKHPDWDVGKLTELCKVTESDDNFAKIAMNLELVDYMDVKNPPPEPKTNETLNAEAFEALFGVIYLNKGLEETRRIVRKYLLADIE